MQCQIFSENMKRRGSYSAAQKSFDALHPMFNYRVSEVPEAIRTEFAEAERFVVIGLGGSVLPLKVFVDFFDLSDRILFLDTVDPLIWKRIPRDAKTLFCVASKSGETLEIKTLLAELVAHDLLAKTVIVTDSEKGWLRQWTQQQKLPSLPIPSDIGGRFTNFTVFHRALLERFGKNFEECRIAAETATHELKKNPQLLSDLFDQLFESGKNRLILWGYGEQFRGLLEWTQQVIAESLGKISKEERRHGIFPIVLRGPQDQHAVLQILREGPLDEVLWFFETPFLEKTSRKMPEDLGEFSTLGLQEAMAILFESTFRSFHERQKDSALAEPLARWTLNPTAADLGRMIGVMQAFIEYAGQRLQINAFDQPGVERGKEIARALMKEKVGSPK